MPIEYVELDEEMEAPCKCDCGEWFDLNDGYSTLRGGNKVVCPDCHQAEEEAKVSLFTLRKHDRFIYRKETYTVKRRYISENAPLVAVPEIGVEAEFYYDEEVLKINR